VGTEFHGLAREHPSLLLYVTSTHRSDASVLITFTSMCGGFDTSSQGNRWFGGVMNCSNSIQLHDIATHEVALRLGGTKAGLINASLVSQIQP
jgi:hypothetical protein